MLLIQNSTSILSSKIILSIGMEYDVELGKQLVDELLELWVETKTQCERIEDIVKQLKEK